MPEFLDIPSEDLARVRAALRLNHDTGNISIDAFMRMEVDMDGYEFERALVGDPDGPAIEEFIDCLRQNYVRLVCEAIDANGD